MATVHQWEKRQAGGQLKRLTAMFNSHIRIVQTPGAIAGFIHLPCQD
ncbi:hypothetical protein IQ218_01490 [Synechocystis salina LEGE 06099]|nr:hypothetical protein [Synechocystis salina]MBE9202389.1 hypothetical protein [Synechocystis salina LEGE 06099]